MKKLLISVFVLLTYVSYGQEISFDIYDDVDTYGKECGVSTNDLKNIKKYNNPTLSMKINVDHNLLDLNTNEIYLYFDDDSKAQISHHGYGENNLYYNKFVGGFFYDKNDFAYMLDKNDEKNLIDKLKTKPIVKVEMIFYQGRGISDVICETVMKDPYEFVKFFNNE